MATLNARASAVIGTSNTTWNTTANAIDGAFGVNNATYCNWTNTTANADGYIELGFGSQMAAIPSDATVTSIEVRVRHYESNSSRIDVVSFQPFDGVTAIGSAFVATRATSARTDTATFAVTKAQVQSPSFKIRVNASRFNGTQAGIFYLDYVDVVVTYTRPEVVSAWNGTDWVLPEFWNGTSWRTDAEVWNGTRWIPIGDS